MPIREPIRPGAIPDLTGKRFERSVVLKLDGIKNNRSYWICKCDCGATFSSRSDQLKSGDTKSCGCYNYDRVRTHGLKKTPEYKAWQSMRQRCENPNDCNYRLYGAIGIKVCHRWKRFENFIQDMGFRPSRDHSIDRINNDGDYKPSNCRWATRIEQANNRCTNLFVEYLGVKKSLTSWARDFGLRPGLVWIRVSRLGWEIERALTTKSGRPKF